MLGLFSQENGDLPRRKTKGGDKVRCALSCGSGVYGIAGKERNASED